MAWPTSTASTANVDSGSDNPGLARADIKQNVDNVNSIISEFGTVTISSPVQGQALVYDGSGWVNSGAVGTRRAALSWTGTSSPWTVQLDTYSIVDSVSTVNITLPAGTYRFKILGSYNVYHSNPSPEPELSSLVLYNTTSDTSIDNIDFTLLVRTDDSKTRVYGVGDVITQTFTVTTQVRINHTNTGEQSWRNLSVEISEA